MADPVLTYVFTNITDTDPTPDPDDLSGDYLEIKIALNNDASKCHLCVLFWPKGFNGRSWSARH